LFFLFRALEAFVIKCNSCISSCIDHEIKRQSISLVQMKKLFTRDDHRVRVRHTVSSISRSHPVSIFPICDQCIQLVGTGLQDTRKLQLLRQHNLRDALRRFLQLWVSGRHLIANRQHHLMHEGLFLAEQPPVADASAKDFAEHVAAAFVGRLHAIRDEERGGAGVVRNDPQRRRTLLIAQRQPL
jgi:hypothetical protein